MSERMEGADRCRAALAQLIDRAGESPLVLIDCAYRVLGAANREACDGHCSESEWVDELVRLIGTLTLTAAGWDHCDTDETLERVRVLLDRDTFEREVTDDIESLPEVDR